MNTLVVQWLGLHASTAGGIGLIPGQRTKTLHASRCGQTKNKLALSLKKKKKEKPGKISKEGM